MTTATILEGRAAARSVNVANPARCEACGCTDRHGCAGGCYWLAVNRADRTGICSNCPHALRAWRNQQAAK